MIRRFRVRIEGRDYDVEVEEIGGSAATPAPRQAPPRPAATAAAAAAPTGGAAEGGVTAPLPGVVLEVRVERGQKVAAGEVLCVLEAMKMENEIIAPRAGTVADVRVARGAAVNAGDVLFVLS